MRIPNNIVISVPLIDQMISEGEYYGESAGLEHLFQETEGTPTQDLDKNSTKK